MGRNKWLQKCFMRVGIARVEQYASWHRANRGVPDGLTDGRTDGRADRKVGFGAYPTCFEPWKAHRHEVTVLTEHIDPQSYRGLLRAGAQRWGEMTRTVCWHQTKKTKKGRWGECHNWSNVTDRADPVSDIPTPKRYSGIHRTCLQLTLLVIFDKTGDRWRKCWSVSQLMTDDATDDDWRHNWWPMTLRNFSSPARIMGECSTIHSAGAFFLYFFI